MVSPRAPAIIQQALSAPWKITRLVARAPASLWLRALPGTSDSAFDSGFFLFFLFRPPLSPRDERRADRAEWRLIKSYKLSFAAPPLSLSQGASLCRAPDKEQTECSFTHNGAAAKQHIDTVLIGI